MAGNYRKERSLEETPTWAVAVVCAIFVIISILIEHGIHSLGKWFQKRQKKAMMEALEKIKAELMLLGFISLLLTIGTYSIPAICIPEKIGYSMLPCERKSVYGGDGDKGSSKGMTLVTAAGGSYFLMGKVALISQSGMHDLHIFIFALAVFHVLYSVATIFLAKAKMKKWEAWESETKTLEYQYTNGISSPIDLDFWINTSNFLRETSFWFLRNSRHQWIVAFFRQFFGSVSKVDYLTMRNGFINAHFAANTSFDFHKYIKRSMEDDFKVVVGIRMANSQLAVTSPLDVGTKLEVIIMDMAEEIQERSAVVRGAPVVEPNNKYFWFNRPQWILFLIHYTLFQNAFQMAYFLWVWGSPWGVPSNSMQLHYLPTLCFGDPDGVSHEINIRGADSQGSKELAQGCQEEKQEQSKREGSAGMNSHASPSMSVDSTPSRGTSPLHLLHNHKHRSTAACDQTDGVLNSPTHSNYSYPSDTEISDIEAFSPRPRHATPPLDHQHQTPTT
ncbi:glucan endo-1,3-beta-glucosidase 12-like [Hibiscus syriacus]|uniref:MLO-like protein n=1 Tax=Hibiscus syriacus TaxID=106335 RepID=A0A6A3CVV9_HIBSY|nr:glucan endo-1,3-beta-glucosidase 12-like [Hibiscus syriacus]